MRLLYVTFCLCVCVWSVIIEETTFIIPPVNYCDNGQNWHLIIRRVYWKFFCFKITIKTLLLLVRTHQLCLAISKCKFWIQIDINQTTQIDCFLVLLLGQQMANLKICLPKPSKSTKNMVLLMFTYVQVTSLVLKPQKKIFKNWLAIK